MALQAFIDESKTDDKVLVLAGYISTVERWESFSDRWQEQLSMQPVWPRFKMSAVNRSDSDVAWERAKHHYKIILEHVIADICVAIPIPPILKAVDDFGLPPGRKNPYYMGWMAIIATYMKCSKKVGLGQRIDFIFDELSEKINILNAWDQIYGRTSYRKRRFIKNAPVFRSDDEMLPLQAADFAAWWARRRFLEKGTILDLAPLVPWKNCAPDCAHIYAELSPESVREILEIESRKTYRFSASLTC